MNLQPFGKYQLIKKLATGGMAEVWLARQTGIEGFKKEVVVKRILPHLADDPEFVQMFLNEAKIAARFSHPNIAQIFDFGLEPSTKTYYIAMEFIRGEDLGRVMRKAWSTGQWIARPLAIRIVAACCEGLYYAHTQTDERGVPLRVVHRDISPQNILISFDGGVKLVDFGIAKASDVASMTKSGAIKGKFAYMSPEQASGKPLDHRSDIFAIGLVLYELLTGVRPLKRDSELATLQAALECAIEPPSAVADVPSELDEVVMHGLTKLADDRYRDARMFQMALEEFLVAQRWVASSVQISELMETLFADRIAEEKQLGHANPPAADGSSSVSGSPAPPPPPSGSWEAPPQQPGAPATRPMSSDALRRVTGPRTDAPKADVQGWEAPPAEMKDGRAVEPSARRNSVSGAQPAPSGRTSSRVDARRASEPAMPRRQTNVPPPDTDDGESTEAALLDADGNAVSPTRSPSRSNVPKRRTSTGTRPATNGEGSGEEGKRRSGVYSRDVLRKTGDEMPQAPPRRQSGVDNVQRQDGGQQYDDIDAQLAKAAAREKRGSALKGIVALAVAIAIAAGAWMQREKIVSLITHGGGQEYYVSVDAKPEVEVFVIHKDSEKLGKDPVFLGHSPLNGVSGPHPGDQLLLENKLLDIRALVPVNEGLAVGDTQKIKKEFKSGKVRVRVAPKSVSELKVYSGDSWVADVSPTGFDLVEGTHSLELRGPKLKKPVPFEVTVKADSTVDTKNIDLTAMLSD
ncbi:MAG: serine/threonine protein kinase [Myxococcaceae bacterium]